MYQPTINDRVKWKDQEGWVYCITDRYFTLEVATKTREDDLGSLHKKYHVLVLVFKQFYHQVVYLGHRKSKYDDTLC